ncbi:conserved hypothetical protein [metagenome]|uniref:Protoporphyrinogen oxidase n=1 Tax=metagenome TaxID=256318 RepID=A0A2P2BWQ2_9ZZZZ
MNKTTILLAAGAGYVLGARAGHERYDQIRGLVLGVRDDPRVRKAAHQAADEVRDKAPIVKDKIVDAAVATAEKVRPSGDVGDQLNPDSLHFQDEPYPQGNLP